MTITAFSAATIAAEVVLTDLDTGLATAGSGGLLAVDADGAAPSLVLFGTGVLVDALVLDVHRRRVQLLGRFLSSYLRPWEDLDDATKQYDREVIRDLPGVLTEVGLGHAPLPPAS